MPGAGYGHMSFGGGLTMLIALIVVGLVTGWAVASVYNVVIGRWQTTTAINQAPLPRHE